MHNHNHNHIPPSPPSSPYMRTSACPKSHLARTLTLTPSLTLAAVVGVRGSRSIDEAVSSVLLLSDVESIGPGHIVGEEEFKRPLLLLLLLPHRVCIRYRLCSRPCILLCRHLRRCQPLLLLCSFLGRRIHLPLLLRFLFLRLPGPLVHSRFARFAAAAVQ